MRYLTRMCVVSLLVTSLLTSPALAAAKALGVVVQAQNALLSSVPVVLGSTVFSGDQISTAAAGSIRVRVGSAQIYLLADSAATLDNTRAGTSATLGRGTVGFSTPGEDAIVVHALRATIRPSKPQPTHAQVGVVSPTELLVTSFRGALEVRVGSEVHVVPEATSYRVILEPEPQDPEGVGAEAARRARVVKVLVGGGIAAAVTGVVIWQNVISPSTP